MWKILRICLVGAMLLGLALIISPAMALDMSATSVNITITVSPLLPPVVTNGIGATNVAANTARLNGEVTSTGNENPTITAFIGTSDGGTDPASWDDNISLGAKALGAFYYDAAGLIPTTTYYYRMRAVNTGGTDWADSTENFTTTILFNPPSGLILTDLGAITVTANWTIGAGSTYTMIRASRTGYPTSVTEGELVYYGDAESVNSTGFALDTSAYFLSAFGFLADNVTSSSTYATASIGGEGMTGIATAINNITTYIPDFFLLFLMAGLVILAFWHRDNLLYVLSGLLFIVYGFGAWASLSHWLSIALVLAGIVIFMKAFIHGRAKA